VKVERCLHRCLPELWTKRYQRNMWRTTKVRGIQLQACNCAYVVKKPDKTDEEQPPPVILDDKQVWNPDVFHALSAILLAQNDQ
jgi:hypothetical protein